MSERVWPETLCADLTERPKLASPIRIDGWIACTDGRAVVAIPDDGRSAQDAWDGAVSVFMPMLNADAVDPLTFDVAALMEWCGPSQDECPDCTPETRGKACLDCTDGFVDCECDCGHVHEIECDTCEGAGESPCGTCKDTGIRGRYALTRRGMVAGVAFSPRILAAVLEGAPAGNVQIATQGPTHAILVRAEGWRGAVMPLRWDADYEYDAVDHLALEVPA